MLTYLIVHIIGGIIAAGFALFTYWDDHYSLFQDRVINLGMFVCGIWCFIFWPFLLIGAGAAVPIFYFGDQSWTWKKLVIFRTKTTHYVHNDLFSYRIIIKRGKIYVK